MKDTKDHILKTSLRLFLRKNYKEVTMQEIVRETGLSKGAFYHYFTGKEKLFEEVVRYFFEQSMMADYRLYPNDSLKGFYSAYLEQIRRNIANHPDAPESNPFVFAVEAMRRLPNLREILANQRKTEISFWKTAIKNAKSSGEIATALSDADVANMFINLVDGILLHHALSQGDSEDTIHELKKTYDHLFTLLVS